MSRPKHKHLRRMREAVREKIRALIDDPRDPVAFYKFCLYALRKAICPECLSTHEPEHDTDSGKKYCWDCSHEISGHGMRPIPHAELCKLICESKPANKTLILCPRGAYKSSLGVECYAIWRILHDPDIRILIDSETDALSQATLALIKSHFESPWFKWLFGDWHTGSTTWRKTAILVTKRRNRKREPTVSCSGVDKAKTGRHYDLLLCDDLVGKENVGSEDMREKVREHHKALTPLGDAHAQYFFFGTRWHMADLYSHILGPLKARYRSIVRAADEGNHDRYEKIRTELLDWTPDQLAAWGDYYFPEVLSPEFLEGQEIEEGTLFFQCQYRNRPVNPDTSLGTCAGYFTEPPERMIIGMAIDPAAGLDSSKAHTGVAVVGRCEEGKYWVLEAAEHDWTPEQLVHGFFRYEDAHEPKFCEVERAGVDASFRNIQRAMQERNDPRPGVEEVPPSTKQSKEDRIYYTLQPPYSAGLVYHHESLRGSAYEMQLIYFPGTSRLDIVDAAEKVFRRLRKMRVQPEKSEWEKPRPTGMDAETFNRFVGSPQWRRTAQRRARGGGGNKFSRRSSYVH